MLILRPYQREAVDKTIEWIKRSTRPCLVEMSVGAGKSVYIAEVARIIHEMSGKRVLCIAPRAELVTQNSAKYKGLGLNASVYSASAGQKNLRYPVVFATPMSVKSVAKRLGHEFAAVIIDEGEGVTPVIKQIIADLQSGNPNLRVIGTTGTPFRTGQGYVYRADEQGKCFDESRAKDPFYYKLLYRVTTRQLLDMGYLTPARAIETGSNQYATLHLETNRMGKFDPADIDKVFVGHGRKTAYIVADAMQRLAHCKAIVFFAATVRHAEEIAASLHESTAAVVHGGTKERKQILDRFASGKLRVLINVDVLTVGWDCPRVDAIVLMRATESARLFTQIIGRCLRLSDGKTESLIADYAENIERHAPDGELFSPEVRVTHKGEGLGVIKATCPHCAGVNEFAARQNDSSFAISEHGYFVDLDGEPIMAQTTDGRELPMPAHYGRRCQFSELVRGELVQCDYRWSSKPCPDCEHDNDIAARHCKNCRAELVNPGDKLVAVHTALKKDPTQPQCDAVLAMDVQQTVSRAGREMMRVTYTTENRVFAVYIMTKADTQWQSDQYEAFLQHTANGTTPPRSIGYKKDGDFYRILSYNKPTDQEQLNHALSRLANHSGQSTIPGGLPHRAAGADNTSAAHTPALA